MQEIRILEDQNFIDFEANTFALALRKFFRLQRIRQGSEFVSDNILDAGKDLKKQEDINLFIDFLANPSNFDTENYITQTKDSVVVEPNESEIRAILPTISLVDDSKQCIESKIYGNTKVIHVKNGIYYNPIVEDDQEEEKIMIAS